MAERSRKDFSCNNLFSGSSTHSGTSNRRYCSTRFRLHGELEREHGCPGVIVFGVILRFCKHKYLKSDSLSPWRVVPACDPSRPG